jgi:hypothetical protein
MILSFLILSGFYPGFVRVETTESQHGEAATKRGLTTDDTDFTDEFLSVSMP